MIDHYPPARRRRQGKLWLGVSLAVIAVGVLGYALYLDLTGGGEQPAARDNGAASEAVRAPRPAAAPSPEPAVTRRDEILTCTAVNGQVFYTNATRCEEADLENRVNVLPAYEPPRPERRDCLGAQGDEFRAQTFLAACQESFNQALELERMLLESPDPAGSRAGRRYCDFITRGVQAGCMATSDQFCFLHICQEIQERGES